MNDLSYALQSSYNRKALLLSCVSIIVTLINGKETDQITDETVHQQQLEMISLNNENRALFSLTIYITNNLTGGRKYFVQHENQNENNFG